MEIWQDIEKLIPVYKGTFKNVIDFERFNNYAATFHSTAIEGSTLTLTETNELLEKGLTAKGKPLEDHNMVVDHHKALLHTLKLAESKTPLSIDLLKEIASLVMKQTGSVHTNIVGTFDESKGDFRLHGLNAGQQYFGNYEKVPAKVSILIDEINNRINQVTTNPDKLKLSFLAHFDLVTIHPFGNGNGRMSRLLMNYVQHYHSLPITPVYKDDRVEYINSLMETRAIKKMDPFYDFMAKQYLKHMKKEIQIYKDQIRTLDRNKGKDIGYSLVF